MSDDNAPLTATLKAGDGFEAPWLSVRADTPGQLSERLDLVVNAGVAAKVAQAAVELQANWNAAHGLGAQPVADGSWNQPASGDAQVVQFPTPQPAQAPVAAQQAQSGAQSITDKFGNRYTKNVPGAPDCPHGTRILKEGLRKDGSPYKAYICPQIDKYFRVQSDCSAIYQ